MEQQKIIENLVLTCIDTAKAMLDEYQTVLPFGIRSFNDSDDFKMNCPADKLADADWQSQIDQVVSELKQHIKNENIYATALVTELVSDEEKSIGVQIETAATAVLFVYPFHKENQNWHLEEPIQTEQLLATVFE